MKHSPGVGKGWTSWDADGTRRTPDYNVATITDSAAGDRVINWDTDFSTAVYAVAGALGVSGSNARHHAINNQAAGSVQVIQWATNHTSPEDSSSSILAMGDQ